MMISPNQRNHDGPTALEFRRLSIFRDNRRVVGRISLRFSHGTVTGLHAENGSGKSSLLHAAAGLLRVGIQGEILWFQRHPCMTDAVRRRIGIQLQSAPVFSKLSVREQLGLVAANRLGSQNMAIRAMNMLFEDCPILAARQHVHAAALNGGAKRLLSVALAAVGLVDGLLILDEPTNDLGKDLAVDLGRCIRRFAERDRNAVIVVSHDREWLQSISDTGRFYELRNTSSATTEHPSLPKPAQRRITCKLPLPDFFGDAI